jgi:hypothetical protein
MLARLAAAFPLEEPGWREYLELLLTHPEPPGALSMVQEALRPLVPQDAWNGSTLRQIESAIHIMEDVRRTTELPPCIPLALQAVARTLTSDPRLLILIARRFMRAGGIADVLDASTSHRTRDAPVVPEDVAMLVAVDATKRAVRSLLEENLRGADAFEDWPLDRLLASLESLILAYTLSHSGTSGHHLHPEALHRDFHDFGSLLWRKVEGAATRGIGLQRSSTDEISRLKVSLGRLALHLQRSRTPAIGAFQGDVGASHEWSSSHLRVCREAIPNSSDKHDREEIERHRILEAPLPVTALPAVGALSAMKSTLVTEFPWALPILDVIFDELIGRARIGARDLVMPSTLLVGPPGAGKSRLARRIAEVLALPRLDVSIGGTADTKILGGTNRGWASGRPSDLATLLATHRRASAIVLLDEIDKALDRHRDEGGVRAYLLGFLEPETACRQYDGFLKVPCDYSKVSWICTANALSPIPAPLRSRLRILSLPQPSRTHFMAVAVNTLHELADRWSVDRSVLPTIDVLRIEWHRLHSARQVRMAVEERVAHWSASIVRH